MKLFLAADHRGFQLKEDVKLWLAQAFPQHEVIDTGNYKLDPLDDYVDYSAKACENLNAEPVNSRAILFCGSGVGVSVVANRFKKVRCALSTDPKHIQHARTNDHVNALAIATEYSTPETIKLIIETFLTTPENNQDKYLRRIHKLESIV